MRLLFLLFFSTSTTLLAAPPVIQFQPNRGQTDSQIRYLSRSPGGNVFFTDTEIVFNSDEAGPVKIHLKGSNPAAPWEASEPTGEETSYHVGRDPQRWADQVPHYGRLVRRNIYPGIDAAWHGNGRRIEYDFLLEPHADPRRIRIQIKGARRVYIDRHGELVIASDGREIRQHKPVIYQTGQDGSRVRVSGGFRLFGPHEAGFIVGRYDRSRPLVIDPVVDFSTYLGGAGEDEIIYSSGDVTAGNTSSFDFPGAQPARRKSSKPFFKIGLTTRIFGGSDEDRLTAVLQPFPTFRPGAFVLFGYTNSTDLPTYPQAVQPNFAGGASDGFVAFLYEPFQQVAVSYYGTAGEDRITGTAATPAYTQACVFTGWTTGRGLPISFTGLTPPVVDGPGGGADGFVATCALPDLTISFLNVRYFGGDGDDRPASILYWGGYYIAGETSSTNFPNASHASTSRSGDSDAFVVHYNSALTNLSSVLFGGTGSDRALGITNLPNLTLAVAGTTTSHDLPLLKPLQPAFGGGASDAFTAVFAGDLSQVLSSSYWGGSAAEEVTAVSGDAANGWFIAGWTSSSDFPAVNAIQPTYGGGPDDGFLLHLDENGRIHQSTFFGGSGNDKILGVAASDPYQAAIAGQTTSADLPLQNSEQDALRGPSDGFIARVSTKLIPVSNIAGSKGFRAAVNWRLPLSAGPITYTLTSSDPASVLLAEDVSAPSTRSITLSGYGYTQYYVECQTEETTADITVTATGYPAATARVFCVRPSLSVGLQISPVPGTGRNYRISLWSDPLFAYVSLIAINRDGNELNALLARSNADRIPVHVQASDPAVIKASTLTETGAFSLHAPDGQLMLTPMAMGATDITFSSPNLTPASSVVLHFDVVSPVSARSPAPIPGGFQVRYNLALEGRRPPPNTTATVTSGDPSSMLVTTDPKEIGKPTVELSLVNLLSAAVYLQALTSSGEAPLTISVNGFDPVTVPVRFKEPVLTLSSRLLSSPTLAPGQTEQLSSSFEFYVLNPQSKVVRLSLDTSDASVIMVSPPFIDLDAKGSFATFQVQGAAAGTATVTLRASNGVTPSRDTNPLTVTVSQRPMELRDVEVGNNLAAPMVLNLPAGVPVNARVTISSSDPEKVLLAPSATAAGQAQISVSTVNRTIVFYALGLATFGEAKILASVPGAGPVTATATLVPSGIGWLQEVVTSDLYAIVTSATVTAFALDPATLIPIGIQTIRQGVEAVVQIQGDRPDVAVPLNDSAVLPKSGTVNMRNIKPGDTMLTLIQPPGFTTPASKHRMRWHVSKAPLRFAAGTLGIHTQRQMGFTDLPAESRAKMATVRSSDPSKLVISADSNVLGSGTVTVMAGGPFYIQALDSRGPVYLQASLEGFADTEIPIRLTGTGILLSVQEPSFGSGSILRNDGVHTTLLSGPTPIRLNLALVDPVTGTYSTSAIGLQLRPGLDRNIIVRSTNPAVGVVQGSPVDLDENGYPGATVQFVPVGLGETEVNAVPPPGFTIPIGPTATDNGRIAFHVKGP